MSQWGGGADSGILRNKARGSVVGEGKPEELLVFGYACKLFRDDEKALLVDQGKHLIPWMGDESLRIDRYDGRGTLSDLKQYEASREGYDTIRWLGLSESERKLEELCDSERYYSLEINEEEEELYKEEEAKRRLTNAFQYSYDENGSADTPKSVEPEGIPTVPEFNEDEQPYVPSPSLDVPVDISIPNTIKEYGRIEKTALFVCRQGQQMEILIKAKQSDNPQFSFLTQSDSLYKFYRHVLSAFKNGRYQPQYNKKSDQEKQDSEKSEEQNEKHYLHPSLISSKSHLDQSQVSSVAASAPSSLTFQPSANCAYSQLVTKIQGATVASAAAGQHAEQAPAQLSAEQQQYYQYYYLQQYYDYYRQMLQNGQNGAQYASLPQDFHQLDSTMQNFVHQLAYAQYVQHCQQKPAASQILAVKQDNNSYAQIVSNLNKDGMNPYAANVPQLPDKLENTKAKPENPKTDDISGKNEIKEVVAVEKSLLSLAAAYGSGSETEESGDEVDSSQSHSESEEVEEIIKPEIKVPPAETQVIIDKMADYVFKNGAQFEDIIKAKNDPRFDFLKSDHEFHDYYKSKLRELRGEPDPQVSPSKEKVKKGRKSKPKKIIVPVSFSIKKPKEEPPKEIKSALPVEESSDEEQEKNMHSQNLPTEASVMNPLLSTSSGTIYNIQDQPVLQKLSHILEGSMAMTKDSSISSVNGKPGKIDESKEQKREEQKVKKDKPSDADAIIDIDALDNKDKKAGDKIKDKLAAVAREKLASVSREKALQLERKRKAAAFLKLKLQNESVSNADPSSASPLVLNNFKQQPKTHKKVTEKRESTDSSVGNEPIFDDLPSPKKKHKEDNVKRQEDQSKDEQRSDEEVQKRLENVLDISASITEQNKSSAESGDSSSGDCEIVEVSYPKRQKKRSRSKSRSRSEDRSRSKEKKRHKEKKRKRSHSPKTVEKNKRKKDKKKKSHKRKHEKSSQDVKHRKKSKKHRKSRSRSRGSSASS